MNEWAKQISCHKNRNEIYKRLMSSASNVKYMWTCTETFFTLTMTSYSISILLFFIRGLKLISGTREIPWPIFCQTKSGEFCRIEMNQRKLFCPSSCNDDTIRDGHSQLIVDLTIEGKSVQHSRSKREVSPLDLFITTLFAELLRLFIDNSIRSIS